jgi:hypothetical protein
MGNQPSAPAPPSSPPSPPIAPPPLPPPCDLDCQKQKQLALLKSALDQEEEGTEAYEKARIAYYTLLNGQGWLNTEKQRIATEVVEPVLKQYKTNYDALKGEKKSQAVFTNLSNMLKSQEEADQSTNAFLKKEMTSDKDRADVLNRLNQLNAGTPVSQPAPTSYIPMIVDLLIALLAIGVLYFGYTKLDVIKQRFGSTSVPIIPT